MPTTLKAFHEKISNNIGRGNSWDTKIPVTVKTAARNLETNFSFEHMRREVSILTVDATAEIFQDTIFNDLVKKVSWIRFVEIAPSGCEFYKYIRETDWDGLSARYDTKANWFIGFSEYTRIDSGFYAYTDWPDSDSASPDLLQKYESLLEAATMMLVGSALRDKTLRDLWNDPNDPFGYQNLFNAVLLSEQEVHNSGEAHVMLPYVPR